MSATGLPVLSNSVVIRGASCGTDGCYSSFEQLGPVTRTRYGYPRVPVAVNTNMGPKKGISKYWFIADCYGRRIGLYSNDSDGADAVWWELTKTKYRWISDQWRLLCRAAGEL